MARATELGSKMVATVLVSFVAQRPGHNVAPCSLLTALACLSDAGYAAVEKARALLGEAPTSPVYVTSKDKAGV